jgi:RHS repeat-associated protein
MVADLTGSLAGIKRHDYLPFGEEVGAGVGGRTQAQGYSQVDNVRQHFTGKERDNETGMDYFGERYYSNSLGRFTTVDPLGASARTLNPQTFNRYTYVLNNPLRYIDPSGLKEEDPWNQLSKDEQRAIRTKLTIDKSHRTFRDAFNALVTVQGDARATANNIGTIKNFIAAVGGQNGSNIWNQIQRIDKVDARSGDMSSVISVTVRSRDEFKQALREEGYTDNAQWDKTGSGRLDSLREGTPYSTDPELHFESYPNSPTSFNAHWDPTSVNFDTVQRKFVAAGVGASVICDFNCGPVEAGRMLERAWSASQHGSPDHPTPGQVRDYQKRVGLAPKQ